ncbi:MAG: hypothetical protein A2Z88_11080 [Omnitrophica WOR_2 bacterium GWA2_47_8]|nr:MAG: hypothetical protein A2Z88_11080 [Omnitrophica WOR_2 bacterium GWA2_47_8]
MKKEAIQKGRVRNIVLGVTGSIAAYKAGDIIRRLQEEGFSVQVIMTKEAEKFITPLTITSLLGNKVHRDMFDEGDPAWPMSHISLAKEADILLIAPATANIIGKIANGLADDLLTCVVLATRAKLAIAPAMNDVMYKNEAVQENCARLRKRGFQFIEPIKGQLACGTFGEGHLAEVEDIVKAVVRIAK